MSLIDKFRDTRPMFKTNKEAVTHFQAELNEIAQRRNQTVEELFDEAEHATIWNDDLSRAHWLVGVINVLKERK